jgi:hypothetical protein
MSYLFSGLFNWVALLFFIALTLVGLDFVLLFQHNGISASRILPEKLSNGDENPIKITLSNHYNFNVGAVLIDELPYQYQRRDFEIRHD